MTKRDDDRLQHLESLMQNDPNANQTQTLLQQSSQPEDYMTEAAFNKMFDSRLTRLEQAAAAANLNHDKAQSTTNQETVTSSTAHVDQQEVSKDVQYALDQMIYKFLGVLFVAIIIGTAIGALCIMCVMKCCNSG